MTAAPEGDSGAGWSLWGPRRRRCSLGPGVRPGTSGVPPRNPAAPELRSRPGPGAPRGAPRAAQSGLREPPGLGGRARRGRWRCGRAPGGREGPRHCALGWARAARAAPGPARGLLPARRAPPRPAPAPPRAAAVPRVALPRDGPRASALPHRAHGGAAAAALGGCAAAAAAVAARRVRGRLGPSGRRQHVGYQGKSCRPRPAHEPKR